IVEKIDTIMFDDTSISLYVVLTVVGVLWIIHSYPTRRSSDLSDLFFSSCVEALPARPSTTTQGVWRPQAQGPAGWSEKRSPMRILWDGMEVITGEMSCAKPMPP